MQKVLLRPLLECRRYRNPSLNMPMLCLGYEAARDHLELMLSPPVGNIADYHDAGAPQKKSQLSHDDDALHVWHSEFQVGPTPFFGQFYSCSNTTDGNCVDVITIYMFNAGKKKTYSVRFLLAFIEKILTPRKLDGVDRWSKTLYVYFRVKNLLPTISIGFYWENTYSA